METGAGVESPASKSSLSKREYCIGKNRHKSINHI